MAIPGPPVMDAETSTQVAELTAKGFGSTIFLTTDDAMKAYEELLGARGGVHREAERMPYGIDSGFRDPSGNSIRLAQRNPLADMARERLSRPIAVVVWEDRSLDAGPILLTTTGVVRWDR